MQTTAYNYQYTLNRAIDLFSVPFGIDPTAPNTKDLDEDAERVISQTSTLSKEHLKAIIEVVQQLVVTYPVYVQHKAPELSMLLRKHTLKHSFYLVPLEKTKRLFVSTHQPLYTSTGSQGFSLKNVLMLTFDNQSRLVKTKEAIKSIVTLSTTLDPSNPDFVYTKRRLCVSQLLDHSSHFPKNYAYLVRRNKHGMDKVIIAQEKAICNLLVFHNEVKLLNKLSEANKALLCKELVAGLQEMNAQGLLHRDMKLDNVLVFVERTFGGEEIVHVKISDFGYACFNMDMEALKESLGSFAWASPEMHERAKEQAPPQSIDISNDIWALGLILYILCNGEPAPVQKCLFAMEKLQKNIAAAKAVITYLQAPFLSDEQKAHLAKKFAYLQSAHPQRVYAKDPLDCMCQIEEDMISDRFALRQHQDDWPYLVQSLPASPRTIQAIEHLAMAMLQGEPKERLKIDDAYIEAESLHLQHMRIC